MALTDKLTAIGDAIREKTGGTAELTLDQMVTEIGAISTGGGGDTSIEDSLVARTLTSYTNTRVTQLGQYAFYYHPSLTSVSFPNVTSSGMAPFQKCEKLVDVNLLSLNQIPGGLFQGCSALVDVDLPKATSMGYGNSFRDCTNLVNLNLPNIRSISSLNGFKGCEALVKLDLPKLESLGGSSLFGDCTALTTILIRNTDLVVPLTSTTTSVFSGTQFLSGTGYVYVPDDLVEDYTVATNWASIVDQIKPLSEYVEVS